MDDGDWGCLGWIILAVLGVAAVGTVVGIVVYIIQTFWPILLAVAVLSIAIFCNTQRADARRTDRIQNLEREVPQIYATLDQTEDSVKEGESIYQELMRDLADASRFSEFFVQLSAKGDESATPKRAIGILQQQISEQCLWTRSLEEKCVHLRETGRAMSSELSELQAKANKK